MDVRGALRLLALLAAGISFAGCFSSATLIRVRADGSGTIELTTTLRKAPLAQLAAFGNDPREKPEPPSLDEWFPESDVRGAASRMGSNVRLVSTRAIDAAEVLGRVSVFAFDDVTKLQLEPLPILPAGGIHGASARLEGEHRVTFDFTRTVDGGRVLTARLPDARIEYSGAEPYARALEHPTPEEEALLRMVVGGGRLELTLEPELPIVQTNTLHRQDQRVTLAAIEAERLLFSEQFPKRFLVQPGSLDEIRYQLHGLPGATVSLDRDVRIDLAPPPK